MSKQKITVALVDDHTIFRDGLASLLNEHDDIEVVFSARSGDQMKTKLESGPVPQIVLLDINMPQMDGHACINWVRLYYPEIHVLVLSMYEDDVNIIRMIRGGAVGYILKQSDTQEVLDALRQVSAHGFFMNQVISGKLIRSIREGASGDEVKLSERETQFLKLCASELTYKEIAGQMNVSPRTVDNYRESLFEKLELKSRVGLVLYGIRTGIIGASGQNQA